MLQKHSFFSEPVIFYGPQFELEDEEDLSSINYDVKCEFSIGVFLDWSPFLSEDEEVSKYFS